MKRYFVAALLMTALVPMAHADYLSASGAAEEQQYQQQKLKDAAQQSRDNAARERVYHSLSDSFARSHGGYSGDLKPFDGPQLPSQIYEPGNGVVDAQIIFQFSTQDGFECAVAESFYLVGEKYQNSASVHCIHPSTGKRYDKTVRMKGIRPELV